MKIEAIFSDLPILETERLILRKVTSGDAEEMYIYGANPEVSRYVSWNTHSSIADTREFIGFILKQYKNSQLAPWGIEHKESGQFIGTINFLSWNPRHKTAEIGYVLAKKYWGQGLTTEAANAVIRFGFENMELVRVQAKCLVKNIGSQRVMEKSGMSYEGRIRKGMFVKGEHIDLNLYSILREEFKAG
ncbi:GNAT family N-acetyltransferase [Virgibacillus kekensis]|uniref:GNAT family N-acetyltransferase n=1 Tax=Virgibacillus kekensis TaxID=202261 RepID=A0ABV9DLQ0_9BACI